MRAHSQEYSVDGLLSARCERRADVSLLGIGKWVHHDDRAAVSLETILIIGAIAIPILIFVLRFGWPRIRDYFSRGMENLEREADSVSGGSR